MKEPEFSRYMAKLMNSEGIKRLSPQDYIEFSRAVSEADTLDDLNDFSKRIIQSLDQEDNPIHRSYFQAVGGGKSMPTNDTNDEIGRAHV